MPSRVQTTHIPTFLDEVADAILAHPLASGVHSFTAPTAVAAISPRCAAHVVMRHNDHVQMCQGVGTVVGRRQPFLRQRQTCIDPARFTRVNRVVDQKSQRAIRERWLASEVQPGAHPLHALFAEGIASPARVRRAVGQHQGMNGAAHVACSNPVKTRSGIPRSEALARTDRFLPCGRGVRVKKRVDGPR